MLKHLKNILRSLDEFVGEYPNYIYLVDRSGHVLWVNRFFIAQVKKMNPGLSDTDFENIWDDHEVFGDPLQDKNIQTGKAQKHLIKKNFGGDSEELFIEFLSLPVRKPGGQIEGVLRIGFDVSDIQKAQIKLREKEELFTSIINSSADAIIFLDSHERIVSWNKGAESIFGYTADEIIGKSNMQLIPGEVIESGELDYIHNQLKTKNFIRKYETKRLTKDGKIIYVDLTRTIVHDKNGVPIGVSEIIKDTTKGKELEFELLRTIVELSKINELNEIL
ncbi:MAG: PAS domain-containing protein, partial [Calditrichia bacterium]